MDEMNVKIRSEKVVKKIRKGMNADAEDTGRKCECCGKVVPWGQSMASITATDGPYFRSTEYYCLECYSDADHAKKVEMVRNTWQKRIDFMRSLGEKTSDMR